MQAAHGANSAEVRQSDCNHNSNCDKLAQAKKNKSLPTGRPI